MPNKSNGEGTVFLETGRNVWKAEIRGVDVNGNQKRKSWRDKKKSVVVSKMNSFKQNIANYKSVDMSSDKTFEEYAEFWLAVYEKPKLKPTSYMRKVCTLRNQVYPFIGSILVHKLSVDDIQNMITSLSQQYSHSSVKKAFDAVNGCLKFYRSRTKYLYNPCDAVILPKYDKTKIKFFTKEEYHRIEQEAASLRKNGEPYYRLGQAIIVLLYTGIRLSELDALEWTDVDFEHHTLSITKNAVEVVRQEKSKNIHEMVIQNSSKTKMSNRVIPLSSKAEQALQRLKHVTGDDRYIVATENHQIARPYVIDRTFSAILKNCGIDKNGQHFGVHALRHTFASMLFENGCETKIISEILGHSSVQFTEDTYIHLIQERKARAIKNLDSFID